MYTIIELDQIVAAALTSRDKITFSEIIKLKKKIQTKNKDIIIAASEDDLAHMLSHYPEFFERDSTLGAEGIRNVYEGGFYSTRVLEAVFHYDTLPKKVVKTIYDAVDKLPKPALHPYLRS